MNYIFPLLALWGNKNWPPSMKVKNLKIFLDKMGSKDRKWYSLDDPGINIHLSHSSELFPFPRDAYLILQRTVPNLDFAVLFAPVWSSEFAHYLTTEGKCGKCKYDVCSLHDRRMGLITLTKLIKGHYRRRETLCQC